MTSAEPALADLYREHRSYLWGLCYRMTGSAADAEDLVQDTFERALTRPPADTSAPWRPWLVRVAMNASRDHLRRRKHRAYTGPWLPSPIETDSLEERTHEPCTTEGRYELLESVSFAFLLALEELTPNQRAVLLLRDVFEYSTRETAEALDLSEVNVRTTLRRARGIMRDYESERLAPSPALAKATRELLGRFVAALTSGDVAAVQALLAEDAVALNDGGGRFYAARKPVVGRGKVARFHSRLGRALLPRIEVRTLNGLPALVGEYAAVPGEGWAPRFATLVLPDADGRIARIHTIIAPDKLTAVRSVL